MDTMICHDYKRLGQKITPLIVTHITDTELLTHLDELDSPKWFRQDVYKLSVGANVLNFCNAITDTFSDVMIPCINVFASLMIHWILAHFQSQLAVH